MMDQLVVVKKPSGYTSRDVVNKLSKILGTKKIGHTGTLDPLATGVLVCLVGRYTKLNSLITAYDKEYIAEAILNIKTDTGDITGNIINKSNMVITKEMINKVFVSFPKEYEQTVPKYSAVKVRGKKLYEYARSNEEVKLPKRLVKIYSLELLEFNNNVIKFKVHVSKGTYIRALIEDIASKMGTFGVMKSLERIKQGKFEINDAYTLEDIEKGKYKGLNVKEFLDCDIREVEKNGLKVISNGGIIENKYNVLDKVIFTYNNKDIAIYEVKEKVLKPYLMF